MLVRTLERFDIGEVAHLADIAEGEGYKFLRRFVEDIQNGAVQLDQPAEFFLCVVLEQNVIALGGITPDPYTEEAGVGRIRHVYVHPQHRGKSVGRMLMRELETRAGAAYSRFTLRTDTSGAAQFYESLGYRPVHAVATTHVRP